MQLILSSLCLNSMVTEVSSIDYTLTMDTTSILEPFSVGVCLLVNVLTDNSNRANADINLVAKKNHLKAAAMNSVKFKFDTKARLDLGIVISEDELMEVCLESGVDDYTLNVDVDGGLLSPGEEGKSVVFVDLKDLATLRDALRAKNYLVEASIAAVPKEGFSAISDEDFGLNMAAIDAFEALDDVDTVEHNIDLRDDSEA